MSHLDRELHTLWASTTLQYNQQSSERYVVLATQWAIKGDQVRTREYVAKSLFNHQQDAGTLQDQDAVIAAVKNAVQKHSPRYGQERGKTIATQLRTLFGLIQLARSATPDSDSYKIYVIEALHAAAGIGRNMDLWLP
jgi:uncharacterized protein (UPF0210 family)